jgi:hypothetical protein
MRMDLKIINGKKEGGADQEYVSLKVKNDCNIGDYLLTDKTFEGEDASNKLRHVYWFPRKAVKEGDVVLLYTKKGTNTQTTSGGTVGHIFYWNLKVAVWNDKQADAAILMKVVERRSLPTT